jgi:hypothetical protein
MQMASLGIYPFAFGLSSTLTPNALELFTPTPLYLFEIRI